MRASPGPRVGAAIVLVGSLAESLVNFRGDLMRSLVAQGYEVIAASPPGPPWVTERLTAWGVRFVPLPMSRAGTSILGDLRLVARLRRLFLAERPQVVLGYTIKPVVYGSIAAWLAGVPRVAAMITGLGFTFMPAADLRQRLVQFAARSLYRLGLACADVVFFQNADDEGEFLGRRLLPRQARVVRINGSGVNLNRYPFGPLPSSGRRFLLISRLIADKGVREYIEAARRLRVEWPSAQCHLVGPFDSNPSAITPAELDAAVAAGAITYHGSARDVRPFIRDCHVFVLPSYREGTPRSVLEAMAMGRPILATDAPGCRDTVEPGVTGVLVPPRDAAALGDAMIALSEMPLEALCDMGQASRRRAEAKYDVRQVNQVIVNALLLSHAQTLP